jgi:ATP-dependent DNA helicase RecG
MEEIPTFSERPVREAVLNAVTHRDYRHGGSIFIRHFPRKLVIESPGGFPPGITPENILRKQWPRNRRLADAFAKCGLVERSGQGMDLMFELCIREGKALPDFRGTDEYQVFLTLHGKVEDPRFIRFLETVSRERPVTFKTEDLLVMDLVHREQIVPSFLKENLDYLRSEGVIEAPGKGKFVLARRFYSAIGQKGVYTRKVGLDRGTNKALLLKHIVEFQREGARLADLMQVLPSLNRGQVQWLLRELKLEGKAHPVGPTRISRWFPGPAMGATDKQ